MKQKTSARLNVKPNWFIGGWATKLPREAGASLMRSASRSLGTSTTKEWNADDADVADDH